MGHFKYIFLTTDTLLNRISLDPQWHWVIFEIQRNKQEFHQLPPWNTFLEVSQSLWDILKQTFTPGREEKESQVTEIINFLGSYQHPRLAKLFPASWCIKLWGCTETVVRALQHCVWQGQSSTPKGLVSRRYWSLWHLLRGLVLRQHSRLENRKEITTDEKSKCFEHPWTLFRGKETVIYRLTGRNKVIHWGFCHYSSKILAF